MKIDIHTHTKKCKSGDAVTREISPNAFADTLLTTDVKIVAITNHNAFDLDQFREIEQCVNGSAQVWPGIELDILDASGARGHLLVIVAPSSASDFSVAVEEITDGQDCDSFLTTIGAVLANFDQFKPLYVAHYRQKRPNISEEALAQLIGGTDHPKRVLKEVTNSISAGIYVAHGHRSIYGSDVHDWSLYEEQSRDLPDLRLPVDSFDHFCLLLEKDAAAINTVLNKKAPEELTLFPFGDSKHITLRVFNDINVIFGPKGTGKSCILDAIAKHYSESGIKVTVYRPVRDDRLNDIFDIKGNGLVVDLAALGIKECADEIEELRTATEVGITSLSKYVDYFSGEVTSRNAKRMRLRELSPEEALAPQREFDEFYRSHAETSGFLEFLDRDPAIAKELTSEERSEVMRILQNLGARLESRRRSTFEDWKTVELLNHAIHTFRNEVHRKTGAPAKPTTTGFRDYGLNRLRIAHSAKTVIENMNRLIRARTEAVGNLGTEKGNLEFRTEIVIQNGALTADSRLKPTRGVKKTAQQQVAKLFRKIFNAAFIRSDHLLKMINQSRADNSTERVLRSLLAPDLLIIDDFGLKGSTPNSRVTSTRSSSNGTAGPLRSSPPIAPSVAEE